MKILLDAQLPRSLVRPLEVLGCDVLHTLDLPAGNRSSDHVICVIADRDQRVVFSKDTDFVRSQLLRGTPVRLLIVATGNIGNPDLTALLLRALPELIYLFQSNVLIELSRKAWLSGTEPQLLFQQYPAAALQRAEHPARRAQGVACRHCSGNRAPAGC